VLSRRLVEPPECCGRAAPAAGEATGELLVVLPGRWWNSRACGCAVPAAGETAGVLPVVLSGRWWSNRGLAVLTRRLVGPPGCCWSCCPVAGAAAGVGRLCWSGGWWATGWCAFLVHRRLVGPRWCGWCGPARGGGPARWCGPALWWAGGWCGVVRWCAGAAGVVVRPHLRSWGAIAGAAAIAVRFRIRGRGVRGDAATGWCDVELLWVWLVLRLAGFALGVAFCKFRSSGDRVRPARPYDSTQRHQRPRGNPASVTGRCNTASDSRRTVQPVVPTAEWTTRPGNPSVAHRSPCRDDH
jgi:hypothetical protein